MSTPSDLAPRVTALAPLDPEGRDAITILSDLFEEAKQSGDEPQEILLRWEQQANDPIAVRKRNLRDINRWCTLSAPGLTAIRGLNTTPPLFEFEGTRYGKPSTARVTSPQLSEWRTCKVKMADATGQAPRLAPGVKWQDVWQALIEAAEPTDVGKLGSEAGQVAEWIGQYLSRYPVAATRDVGSRSPYWDGKVVCVFATELLTHLRDVNKERLDPKMLAIFMRAAGATPKTINVSGDDGRTTTNIYRLEPSLHGRRRPA